MTEQPNQDEKSASDRVSNQHDNSTQWIERELRLQFVQPKSEQNQQLNQNNKNKNQVSIKGQEDKFEKLIADKDIDGLIQFPNNASDRRLIGGAAALISRAKNISPEAKSDIYRQWAQSNSLAAGIGMFMLSTTSQNAKDHELFTDRYRKGEIQKLWDENKLSATDLCRLIAYENIRGNNGTNIMSLLDASPQIKTRICQEFFSKTPFGTPKYPGADNLKKDILDYLADKKPSDFDTVLGEIAIQEYSALNDRAQAELKQHWTTEKQKPQNEQSTSEFLIGNHLQQLQIEFGASKWTDKDIAAQDLYSQWVKAKREIAFGDKPNEQAKRSLERLEQDLRSMNEKLELFLNKHINDALKTAGIDLPKCNFKIGEESQSAASYDNRNGRIDLATSQELYKSSFGPESWRAISHELTHHEQNTLILRALVDELEDTKKIAVRSNSDNNVKEEIKGLYRNRIGLGAQAPRELDLTDNFLNSFLDWREKNIGNRHLTNNEKKRAEALIEAEKSQAKDVQNAFNLEARLNSLNTAITYFDLNFPLEKVLKWYADEDSPVPKLEKALGVDHLPDDITQDLKDYERATKNNAPNLDQLSTALRKKIREELVFAKDQLNDQQYNTYEARLHEREAFIVGRRAFFLAKSRENK